MINKLLCMLTTCKHINTINQHTKTITMLQRNLNECMTKTLANNLREELKCKKEECDKALKLWQKYQALHELDQKTISNLQQVISDQASLVENSKLELSNIDMVKEGWRAADKYKCNPKDKSKKHKGSK